MFRSSRALFCIAVLAAMTEPLAWCQALAPPEQQRRIRALADLALAAPPELAADALLKLIERGYVEDPKWKRDLLETAWDLAPRAAYAFEIEPAVEASRDAARLSSALAPGLSTAGIQARIISQIAKVDAKAARDMFLQMSRPAAESPDCSVDRYTSHRAYFDALKTASGTFSADEIKRGDKAVFLLDGFRSMSNPEDFELSLDMIINEQSISDKDFQELLTLWSETLAQAHFPDRLFSTRSIESIATPLFYRGEHKQRGVSLETPLRAFRSYLVRHASAERCSESQSRVADEQQVPTVFNRFAAPAPVLRSPLSAIPVVSSEDITAQAFSGKAKIAANSAAEDKVTEMRSEYTRLRFDDKEQRGSPEWNEQALQFLTRLERWSREFGQSNREFFSHQAEWYGALVYATPEGRLRRLFLDSYVKFLAGSPVQRESPPEWAKSVNQLLGAAGVPDREAWLEEIQLAGDAAIAVYCELARLRLEASN